MEWLSNNNFILIVFLHVLSAIVWIGGMITVRVVVHPSLQSIDEPSMRLGKTLEIIKRLFNLVLPLIILILITAVIMSKEMGLTQNQNYWIFYLKGVIWLVMSANFTYMYIKRAKAQKLYNSGNLSSAKKEIKNFANILLPINITLGVFALFLGIILRSS